MSWIEISQRKKEALQNLIPPQWRLSASRIADVATCLDVSSIVSAELSYNERRITESAVADILTSIATGEMTSHEVISAYCHRAAVAHQLVRMACQTISCAHTSLTERLLSLDELFERDQLRKRSRACVEPGCLLATSWLCIGTVTRTTYKCHGSIQHRRSRECMWFRQLARIS